MIINIATMGKYVYRQQPLPEVIRDVGGGSAYIDEERIPVVMISKMQEIKNKKKIIKIISVDEV